VSTILTCVITLVKKSRIANQNKWVFNEFEAVQFGDKRLVKRFIKMFNDLATLPESSINQASGSWAEAKSAYRFF